MGEISYIYQEQAFDAHMSKLIKNVGIDAIREITRQTEKKISMSQLRESELARISTTDHYDIDQMTFSIRGKDVIIKNSFLGQALAALPPKRREVIFLSFNLNKSDPQIGAIMNPIANSIQYRKKAIQKILKVLKNEE